MGVDVFFEVDASTREGNPGESSYGLVALDLFGNVFYEVSERIGVMTSNEAEFMAISQALHFAKELGYPREIEIRTDSRTAASQLRECYLFNSEGLNEISFRIQDQLEHFEFVEIIWVPRAENQHADRLASAAFASNPQREISKIKRHQYTQLDFNYRTRSAEELSS